MYMTWKQKDGYERGCEGRERGGRSNGEGRERGEQFTEGGNREIYGKRERKEGGGKDLMWREGREERDLMWRRGRDERERSNREEKI